LKTGTTPNKTDERGKNAQERQYWAGKRKTGGSRQGFEKEDEKTKEGGNALRGARVARSKKSEKETMKKDEQGVDLH